MLIYQCINKINGKSYIGKTTKTLEKRKEKHIKFMKTKNNYYFHKALNKYGINNFEWKILYECSSIDELNEKEIFYINYLQTNMTRKYPDGMMGYGYNMTDGGEGTCGYTHTEKTRKILSERNKGKPSPNKGKKLSEETKNKLSISHTGKKLSDETKRKMSISHVGNKYSLGHFPTQETRNKQSQIKMGNKYSLNHKHSNETKKKMSISHIGNKSNTGKKLSEETKRKMSNSQKIRWNIKKSIL